jgi:hypothetical protein
MAVTNVSRPGHMEPEVFRKIVPPVLNLKGIAESLKGIIANQLISRLPELEADLLQITNEIAPVLVSAAVSGDTALRGELEAQIVAIAEINRIRGNAAAIATIKEIAGFALSILSIGISKGLGGIR